MNSLMKHAQFYRENGYLSVMDLLTQEDVTRLQEAFAAAEQAGNVKVGVTSIENQNDAIFRHPIFQEFASDPRIDPDPKLLIGELSSELPTAGACLAGVFEYPPHAPTMDNSLWYFMLPPVA